MGQGRTMARIVLIAALVAGFSFLWLVIQHAQGPTVIAWKGAGVALLALWCGMQARSLDGWLITAVMALGAAGDVLLETHGEEGGAAAFLCGHLVAITLYLRNRRSALSFSQTLLAVLVVPVVVFKGYSWTHDPMVAVYALTLGLMAATAWASRFPRYRVGLGAMLFVASDLLIFARMGPLAGSSWADVAIWLLYFGGQALIAMGVVRTLTTDARGSTP
jgi:uncharacterized membrane protein YhhN